MTQDVVRRRYKEEEIRQRELLQIVIALQFSIIAASGPGAPSRRLARVRLLGARLNTAAVPR